MQMHVHERVFSVTSYAYTQHALHSVWRGGYTFRTYMTVANVNVRVNVSECMHVPLKLFRFTACIKYYELRLSYK